MLLSSIIKKNFEVVLKEKSLPMPNILQKDVELDNPFSFLALIVIFAGLWWVSR